MVVVIDTGESDGAGGGFVAHHLPRGFLRAARRTRVIASETCAGQQRTDSVEFNKAGVMAAEYEFPAEVMQSKSLLTRC